MQEWSEVTLDSTFRREAALKKDSAYWTNSKEDYNYLIVQVRKQASRFRIHRFRPSSEKVFDTVEVLTKDAATQ